MPIAADLRQVRVKFSDNGSGMDAWFFNVAGGVFPANAGSRRTPAVLIGIRAPAPIRSYKIRRSTQHAIRNGNKCGAPQCERERITGPLLFMMCRRDRAAGSAKSS
jgi:hypothetical protein